MSKVRINKVLLMFFGVSWWVQAAPQESFVVDTAVEAVKKSSKKKKKSLTTLRAEFVDNCEELAHSMLQEIKEISRLLKQWAVESSCADEEDSSGSFLYMRQVEILRQKMYLKNGTLPMLKMKAPYALRQENAAVLLVSLAEMQERILETVKAVLVTDNENVFVKANKKELEAYNKEIETFLVESGIFVGRLQALQNSEQITAKKQQ